MLHEQLTASIIGAAMRVHGALGPGFLESVYERALAHELRKEGHQTTTQSPVTVLYDGVVVGEFVADAVVDTVVLLEIKAVRDLAKAHEVQLVNYLTATRISVGLLINFGSPSLEIKRKYRDDGTRRS